MPSRVLLAEVVPFATTIGQLKLFWMSEIRTENKEGACAERNTDKNGKENEPKCNAKRRFSAVPAQVYGRKNRLQPEYQQSYNRSAG
jgi:hypothetical protein